MAHLIMNQPSYTSLVTWSSSNNDIFVLADGSYLTVGGTNALDVIGTGGLRSMLIEGDIISSSHIGLTFGLFNLFPSELGSSQITIGETGSVYGRAHAIETNSNLFQLINHGGISAQDSAIDLTGSSSTIENLGTITSHYGTAIMVEGGQARLSNSGDISSSGQAVDIRDGDHNLVANSGAIKARTNALSITGDDTRIVNSGVIESEDTRGISLSGFNSLIRNSGEIIGDFGAITTDSSTRIINTGKFFSTHDAISMFSGDGPAERFLTIRNSGEIIAWQEAIRVDPFGELRESYANIYNSGKIEGDIVFDTPQDLTNGDLIVNSGVMIGDIQLGEGSDTYRGASGSLDGTIDAGSGHDILIGGAEDNIFNGDSGADTLNGRGGDDTLNGGDHADKILGGAGDDVIEGGSGADEIKGGAGDDTINGGVDDDVIHGGAGDDVIVGWSGADVISGGIGDDEILGNWNADILNGGRGDDTLDGGTQSDRLKGGVGNDVLTGGAHNDVFIFGVHDGHDVITDFTNGQDKIDLSAFGLNPSDFANVVAPALSAHGAGSTFLDLTEIGGTGTIIVNGLTLAQAGASDFIF